MTIRAILAICVASAAIPVGTSFAQTATGVPAQSFPLAAKAGVDSHADKIAPPGAVNQGAFNFKTWKRGDAWDAPPGGSVIWNPVKRKMMQGERVTSLTVHPDGDPKAYCAAANSGVDFIWTEMQHSGGTWHDVANMWDGCPHAKAMTGARVPNANEMDEQHALDLGATVLIIPTVRTEEEAREAVKWAYFPPMGQRSESNISRSYAKHANVPGGYRKTINDNIVVIAMIETLDGLQNADKIAAVPGITAIFAASGDLSNFSGFKEGSPDYEREINIVHDAALRAHKTLCGPASWINRPDFTCFQGLSVSNPANQIDVNATYEAAAKKAFGPLPVSPAKPNP